MLYSKTMKRLLTTCLLWLLAALLPLQGMAGVTQFSCGQAQHAFMPGVTNVSPAPGTPGTTGDTGITRLAEMSHGSHMPRETDMAHATHMMNASHMPDTARTTDTAHMLDMPDHVASQPQPHQHAGGDCSACAACCTGALAGPFLVPDTGFPQRFTYFLLPALLADGIVPATLERPPKTLTLRA
jgi:hypothetical protein